MKRTLILASLMMGLVACETGEDNTMNKAQVCLDLATTAAEATNCLNMVSGIENEKASRIRCSATFIQNGLTKDRFATAFTNMKNTPAGQDPVLAMLDTLAFTGSGASTAASYAATECAKSKSAGMTYFAMLTLTATVAKAINPSNIANALQTIASGGGTASDVAAIGSAAIAAQSTYCGGSSQADPKLCTDLNSAIATGGGNPTAVGQALANLLKQ